MTRVLNPYGDKSGIGEAIAGIGQMMFGDTLTPALKREQMRLESGKADAQARINTSMDGLMNTIAAKGGIPAVMQDPQIQAFLLGSEYDPQKFGTANRLFTATDPKNPVTGDTVTRAMIGAGDSASSTPFFTKRGQDMDSADSRYGVDQKVAEDRYQFNNKPIDALIPVPDNKAVGPFLPGQQPKTMQPGFVPQGQAATMGAQPIIKEGMNITTNPDGTFSLTQGGINTGKPTELSAKADLIGGSMIPGLDALNGAFTTNTGLSTTGAAAISVLPDNALMTDLLQRSNALAPEDQKLILGANAALNYMYQLTGAARTPSEENRALKNIPLASDTPENRELKKRVWVSIAQGIAGQARDPRVKQELLGAVDRMFAGQKAPYGLGSGNLLPSTPTAPAAPAGVIDFNDLPD